MKNFTALILGALLCCWVSTTLAQGIYVEFTTSSGPGTVPVTGEFLVSGVQYGMSTSITVGASAGSGAGKAAAAPLILTKQVDLSSVSLQRQLVRGQPYSRIRVNFYRAGPNGARELVYRITLGTAFVSNYTAGATEVCSTGCPGISETITIEYGQFVTSDFTQQPAGVAAWNFVTNSGTVDNSLLN